MKNSIRIVAETFEKTETADNAICTVKQDISFYYALCWIEMFKSRLNVNDEEFTLLLDRLYKCVVERLKLPTAGDITDLYVVVEQKIE